MTLPPLREVIDRYALFTRKSLGQHFLLDAHLLEKIARQAGDLAGETVVEVGPGPGGLTRALLASRAKNVIAVEKDARCIAALEELSQAYPGRLEIRQADALGVDWAALGPAAIVANLPYNVGTELLLQWLEVVYAQPGHIRAMTLLFQKEVADRLLAAPRTKAYGRLSVVTQFLCEVQRCFDIPPGAFLPPPQVTSTLVRIVPRAKPLADVPKAALERVVAAAFNQRRKMLRSSLKSLTPDAEALLARAAIAPTARAEELSFADFCRLASIAGPQAN
jgi:16S rRNA (adenine1518-N6/adenine1519-N6)-dimethyltransferase